MGTDF